MVKESWDKNNTLMRENLNYKIYGQDPICSQFDLIIYNALKDAFYSVPDFSVHSSGSDEDKVYYATLEHVRKYDYKWFPKSHIKSELKKEFPDKKVSITSYTHPYLTGGDYEITITLKNK